VRFSVLIWRWPSCHFGERSSTLMVQWRWKPACRCWCGFEEQAVGVRWSCWSLVWSAVRHFLWWCSCFLCAEADLLSAADLSGEPLFVLAAVCRERHLACEAVFCSAFVAAFVVVFVTMSGQLSVLHGDLQVPHSDITLVFTYTVRILGSEDCALDRSRGCS